MNGWKLFAVIAGAGLLLLYAYGVWLYLRGKGRERLENAVRALLTLKENGGVLEIALRGQGTVLVFCRQDGRMNWADLRLRIPLTTRSLPLYTELKRAFSHSEYEFRAMEGSTEAIAELRILVEDIWALGSGAKGAEAANLALDVLGFEKDARFIFKLKGKANWRLTNRPE